MPPRLDPEETDDEESLSMLLPKRDANKTRQWKSVTGLVTEADVARVSGLKISAGGRTYNCLEEEVGALRSDNDAVHAMIKERVMAIDGLVSKEEQIMARLSTKDGFTQDNALAMLETLKQLKQYDYDLAGMRTQQLQNVKDIGELKRCMNRIATRSKIDSLLDDVEGKLERREPVEEGGPEDSTITHHAAHLHEEIDAVSSAARKVKQDIETFVSKMQANARAARTSGDRPGEDADVAWTTLAHQLQQARRMTAQLSRLREIEVLLAEEMACVEITRTRLRRQAQVRKAIEQGDAAAIDEKVAALAARLQKLTEEEKAVNTSLANAEKQVEQILQELRNPSMKLKVTPETGDLRAKLITFIHQDVQFHRLLASTRREKEHIIRLMCDLKAAASG